MGNFIVNIRCIILFLFFASGNFSFGQNKMEEKISPPKNIKEQVFLHMNSTFLLSGESLFYKFYGLNPDNGQLSEFSKTGIVELLNKQNEKIFQHQVALEKGMGSSSFFIPASLPSGGYKLIGYTNWMNNFDNNYFEQDLFILNPYQQLNNTITDETIIAKAPDETVQNQLFQLETNKQLYQKRERVILNLKADKGIKGYFSLSVRKIDSFNKPEKYTAHSFKSLYQNVVWQEDSLHLPDLRGFLLTGEISGSDVDLNGRIISISFPGEENSFEVAKVGENGKFSVNLEHEPEGDVMLAQLIGSKNENINFSFSEPSLRNYSKIEHVKKLEIDAGLKEEILERSIYNQIENAYSSVKKDTIKANYGSSYFFGNRGTLFNLDDFNRFDEVQKTFIEVIANSRIRTNSQGQQAIYVGHINPDDQFKDPAFLIVDGVAVQDHQKLLSFPANRIKSIRVIRDHYFLGPVVFSGLVVVETKEGNFPSHFKESYMVVEEMIFSGTNGKFFTPDYEKADLSKIPDYRVQLFWHPSIISSGDEISLSFFTSDVEGTFEIDLEGFTDKGEPVSIKKVIQVQ